MHVSILDHIRHLNFDFSRSLKVKCDGGIGLPIYDFPLMFNYNIWPNSVALRDISLWNLSDLDIDLSRSFKVKCNSVTGLSIYAFLLMFNHNIWPNSAPLPHRRFQNVSDLDTDLLNTWKWFKFIYRGTCCSKYTSWCYTVRHHAQEIGQHVTVTYFRYMGGLGLKSAFNLSKSYYWLQVGFGGACRCMRV